MTNTVVTGIDGSPESEAAAFWAAEEAVRRGASLQVLHAWPWLTPEDSESARTSGLRPAALDALTGVADRIRQAHPGLPVAAVTVGDDPVDGLLAAAKGQELLVFGSRGLGGFAGLLVGSVGLAVAARTEVPLVLVRAAADGAAGCSVGPVPQAARKANARVAANLRPLLFIGFSPRGAATIICGGNA